MSILPFKYDNKSEQSILECAKNLVGKNLEDIFEAEVIEEIIIYNEEKNKGGYGQIIEKYIFGNSPNSDINPDFPCGIDCKVTPLYVKKSNQEIAVKERLSCNKINFHNIVEETWESSSFLKKNKKNLIIRYIDLNKYLDKKDPKRVLISKYPIVDAIIYEIDKSPYFEQIKQDWHDIVSSIKLGRAEDLSESNTQYLGAATKGANAAKSMTTQPFSKLKARGRGFSYKPSLMRRILIDHPVDARVASEVFCRFFQ